MSDREVCEVERIARVQVVLVGPIYRGLYVGKPGVSLIMLLHHCMCA